MKIEGEDIQSPREEKRRKAVKKRDATCLVNGGRRRKATLIIDDLLNLQECPHRGQSSQEKGKVVGGEESSHTPIIHVGLKERTKE